MALLMARPTVLTTRIEASVESVFGFFADPHRLLEWESTRTQMPTRVLDVTVTPEGVGTSFGVKGRVGPVWIRHTSRYTDVVRNERIVETVKGRVLGQFAYSFRPDGSGTRFTLEHVPGAIGRIPVIGAPFDRLRGRRAAGFLDDLRRHLESLTAA